MENFPLSFKDIEETTNVIRTLPLLMGGALKAIKSSSSKQKTLGLISILVFASGTSI